MKTRENGTLDSDVIVERGSDGQLFLLRDGVRTRVRALRCFPWTAPERFVSLRDDDDEEVLLIRDPAKLAPGPRRALEHALGEAGLVLEIERILAVEEDFELRCWKVETRQGARSFQTPRDSFPRPTAGGAQLIEDVQGDVFRLPPVEALDAKSRKLLFAFLD